MIGENGPAEVISETLAEIVLPVLGRMLEEGELLGIALDRASDPEMLSLEVRAGAQAEPDIGRFWIHVGGELSAGELRAVLADQFHDFVAESRFGWGQRRTYAAD